MRIGELARKSGLSRDTIRFYERYGLLSSAPGQETTNRYRDYPDDSLLTLELVNQAKSAGLTIADILRLVAQLNQRSDDDFDGETFLDEKIAEIEARIATSRKFLETLRQTRNALATPD